MIAFAFLATAFLVKILFCSPVIGPCIQIVMKKLLYILIFIIFFLISRNTLEVYHFCQIVSFHTSSHSKSLIL